MREKEMWSGVCIRHLKVRRRGRVRREGEDGGREKSEGEEGGRERKEEEEGSINGLCFSQSMEVLLVSSLLSSLLHRSPAHG
jgi:hypothetical protein